MGALLGGTTVCMYDGSPSGPASALAGAAREVDWSTLWRFAAATGATFFGAGAAFYASCLKADVEPQAAGDLCALRGIGATGSPLAIECYEWIWAEAAAGRRRAIWLDPISGGTDFAGAFVAGLRTLPVVAGEMQCRCLGAAVEAWSEPDASGRGRAARRRGRRARLHEADAVDAALLLGRRRRPRATTTATSTCTRASGATATGSASRRAAARSSTAAATRPSTGTASAWAPPSSTARSRRCPRCSTASSSTSSTSAARATCRSSSSCAKASALDEALTRACKRGIKTALSARHVPNEIFQVASIPRTLSGKKMELPVKKLLLGAPRRRGLQARCDGQRRQRRLVQRLRRPPHAGADSAPRLRASGAR